MEKIRLGQIGIGHNHGEAKMLAARKFPDLFDIVGYAEEDEAWINSRGNLPGYAGLARMSVDELIAKCDAVLEYEKALARIFVSSVEVNGWGRRQLVVCGSKGSVNICPIENKITMTYSDLSIADAAYEDRKVYEDIADVPKSDRYDDMMRDFAAYIKGEKVNPFTYDHEYTVQKVLHACCERTGEHR